MTTAAGDAELTFLSTRQTAVGDEATIPEETMHLAAGVLAVASEVLRTRARLGGLRASSPSLQSASSRVQRRECDDVVDT